MAATTKTFLLLAFMTALFLTAGAALGGGQGMLIALGLALTTNAYAFWRSGDAVLGMYGARQVDRVAAPQLHDMVEGLAHRAGVPMPRLFVIDNAQPNAFATGRDPAHAAVAVHTGAMDLLSEDELAGVIAHELAHIKSRDTLLMTVSATLSGALASLANIALFLPHSRDENGRAGGIGVLFAMLIAPFAATLLQLAISRTREFEADRIGAAIAGNPHGLARALGKIDSAACQIPNAAAERHPATAALFIIHPLQGGALGGLFRTHPPTEQRIARLEALASPVMPTAAPAIDPDKTLTPWD